MSLKIIRSLLFGLLFLPYILLLILANHVEALDLDEVLWAGKNTVVQGVGSTFIAIGLGLVMSLGIPWMFSRAIRILLLLPILLPSIFVILVFLASLNPFPFGNLAVILIQGFLYGGLAAVLIHRSFEERLYSLSEMAQVLGAGRLQFFWASRGLIFRDVASIAFVIFVAASSSFAIPLVVSGGSGTNLEILIYEKIRLGQNWGQAASLVLIQLGIALVLSVLLNRLSLPTNRLDQGRGYIPDWFFSKLSFLVTSVYLLIFCGTLIWKGFDNWKFVKSLPGVWEAFLRSLPFSIGLAFGFGIFIFMSLCGLAFLRPNSSEQNFFRGFIAPSTALVGFAYISLESLSFPRELSYLLALWGVFFLSLYRLGLDRRLDSLHVQHQVAEICGASGWLIFRSITFPQIKGWVAFLAGLGSLWAFCDFALAKMVLGSQDYTVLIVESLLSSYRSDAGLSLAVIQLAIGAMFFLFFGGVAHVLDQKFK
jgi:thiamine transport system permease protein